MYWHHALFYEAECGHYYHSEAIGKLTARLPPVKNAARVIKFDQVGTDVK